MIDENMVLYIQEYRKGKKNNFPKKWRLENNYIRFQKLAAKMLEEKEMMTMIHECVTDAVEEEDPYKDNLDNMNYLSELFISKNYDSINDYYHSFSNISFEANAQDLILNSIIDFFKDPKKFKNGNYTVDQKIKFFLINSQYLPSKFKDYFKKNNIKLLDKKRSLPILYKFSNIFSKILENLIKEKNKDLVNSIGGFIKTRIDTEIKKMSKNEQSIFSKNDDDENLTLIDSVGYDSYNNCKIDEISNKEKIFDFLTKEYIKEITRLGYSLSYVTYILGDENRANQIMFSTDCINFIIKDIFKKENEVIIKPFKQTKYKENGLLKIKSDGLVKYKKNRSFITISSEGKKEFKNLLKPKAMRELFDKIYNMKMEILSLKEKGLSFEEIIKKTGYDKIFVKTNMILSRKNVEDLKKIDIGKIKTYISHWWIELLPYVLIISDDFDKSIVKDFIEILTIHDNIRNGKRFGNNYNKILKIKNTEMYYMAIGEDIPDHVVSNMTLYNNKLFNKRKKTERNILNILKEHLNFDLESNDSENVSDEELSLDLGISLDAWSFLKNKFNE